MMADPLFDVQCLAKTENPQSLVWQAMHQDYSEGWIFDEAVIDELDAGQRITRHLLAGGRGHYGPLEHPSITLAVGYFPHSVMQQARTHRVGVSFDVQSMRYTGQRIRAVAKGQLAVEEAFYVRPVGHYADRKGKQYEYTTEQRKADLEHCFATSVRYAELLDQGFSEEHARSGLPFDYRQHFVMSFNARSLMHFLDLRGKADAQIEIQQLCQLMFPIFSEWMPAIADWYGTNRWAKARLAP